MSHNYKNYTEISLNALDFNPKSSEVIGKKQEIINTIEAYYRSKPESILFHGFNPMMLSPGLKNISVTEVTDQTLSFLDSHGIKYQYIEESELIDYRKKFSWIIAAEEYFTFATSEEEQKNKIELMATLAKDLIITTLKDYKNQDFKDREFSLPLSIHNHNKTKLYLEYHDYEFNDKNSWKSSVYEMTDGACQFYGKFPRRSMFFKQLAKFFIDTGAKQFYVHKNLMYKSLIKKNYEHVISITF